MIDTNKVNKIIQEELENCKNPAIAKTLAKLQGRINDLEENELNYMYEEWTLHEQQRKKQAQQEAEKLFNEYFG